jgi:hypothetical protein
MCPNEHETRESEISGGGIRMQLKETYIKNGENTGMIVCHEKALADKRKLYVSQVI